MIMGSLFALVSLVVSLGHIALVIYVLMRMLRKPDDSLTLPKIAWVLIVLIFPWVGPIAYLVAGERY